MSEREYEGPWGKVLRKLLEEDVTEAEIIGRGNVWISRNGVRSRVEGIAWRDEDTFFKDFDMTVRPGMNAPGYGDPSKCNTIYEGGLDVDKSGRAAVGVAGGYHARLHMMLPPTVTFPQVTIAKRSESLTNLSAMVSRGSMTKEMMRFIRLIVRRRQTIVFSGAGGSGKTTMLRACCNYLGKRERVVVCEDTPELSLPISNVSYLESTPWRPGIDRNMEVTLSYLVAQVNRMRCDRVIVGETRSAEFHGFLQSANSGYTGSMTTLHANSPQDCVKKMSTLDMEAIPGREITTINNGIAQAVDFIIQMELLPSGKHVVREIYSLSDTVSDDTGMISGTPIYSYVPATGLFKGNLSLLEDKKRKVLGIEGGDMPDENEEEPGADEPAATLGRRRNPMGMPMPVTRRPGGGRSRII